MSNSAAERMLNAFNSETSKVDDDARNVIFIDGMTVTLHLRRSGGITRVGIINDTNENERRLIARIYQDDHDVIRIRGDEMGQYVTPTPAEKLLSDFIYEQAPSWAWMNDPTRCRRIRLIVADHPTFDENLNDEDKPRMVVVPVMPGESFEVALARKLEEEGKVAS